MEKEKLLKCNELYRQLEILTGRLKRIDNKKISAFVMSGESCRQHQQYEIPITSEIESQIRNTYIHELETKISQLQKEFDIL